MVKISVIVAVYNVDKYIDKCIKSILGQTFKEFELLLINDGSTDKSREICESYFNGNEKIKLINKSNGGLSDARNLGLDIAKGEYITFVDGDDSIDSDYLERLYNNAVSNDADISACSFKRIIGDAIIYEDIREIAITLNRNEAMEEYLKESKTCSVIACCKLFKKEIFNNIRFPLGRIHEDNFTAHLLINKCNKYSYISYCGYNYLIRKESITGIGFNSKSMDLLLAYNDLENFIDKNYEGLRGYTPVLTLKVNIRLLNAIYDSDKKVLEENIILDNLKEYKWNKFLDKRLTSRYKVAFIMIKINPRIYKTVYKLKVKSGRKWS